MTVSLARVVTMFAAAAVFVTGQAGGAAVLFQDGFSSDEAQAAWTFVDEGDLSAPSRWVRSQGSLIQFSNIAGDKDTFPGTYALAGDESWADYDLCFTLKSSDNDGTGAMFRVSGADSYYRFRWTAEGSNWGGRVLERVSGGEWKRLAEDKTGYRPNTLYRLAFRVSGERIRVYVDDMADPVFDVTDIGTPVRSGKIGLYSWDNAGVTFDNLSVTTPDHPFPPDLFRPAVLDVGGRVYEDLDGDGRRDEGEPGLKEVAVSNGIGTIRSGKDGRFRFPSTSRDESRFVWVCVPSGWKASGPFYAELPDRSGRFEAEIGLRRWPASDRRKFTFAQVTDIHVQGESETMVEDLREVAEFGPDFAISSGDVVNHGGYIEQLERYVEGVNRSPVPVITGPGNHDLDGGWQNYEDVLGPTYFSFDYCGVHFVLLNSVSEMERQIKWLTEDLSLQPEGRPVIVVQHYPPTKELMERLKGRNVVAVMSGHWHSSKVFDHEGILFVNSPPLRFGGIDCSPRGFVLVHVEGGKLTLEQRYTGVRRHLRITVPAEGEVVSDQGFTIRAAAYDSRSPSPEVRYSLDGGQWVALQQDGEMSWSVALGDIKAGPHTLRMQADWGRGEPSVQQVRFEVAASSVPKAVATEDWPAYKGGAARTSAATKGPEPPMELVWCTALGGVSHFASPVVSDGRVYFGISDEEHAGLAGVAALDASSGRLVWRRQTTASVKHTPSVSDGRVFACSVDGTVWAIDARTGRVAWTYDLGGGLDRWVFGAPAVDGGVVYAGVGPRFAAIEASTGREIWTAERMASDWISCLTSPAVGPDAVFMGTNWSSGLFAIDRQTGKHVWNASDGFGQSHSSPAYHDGHVYHAASKALFCLDAKSGGEVWQQEIPGSWPISSPAVAGDRVFLGLLGGEIGAFDARDGNRIWTTRTGSPILFFNPYDRAGSHIMSTPAVAGGAVWCGGVDGRLYAFSADTGEAIWSRDLGAPVLSSPAVSGGLVFVTTYDGIVYCFGSKR